MNSMNLWRNLRLFFFLTLFIPSSTFAFVFTEFGTLNFGYPQSQSDADPEIETSLGASLGLGISLGFQLTERMELELGILFLPRKFSITSSNAPRISFNMTSVHYPLLVRYWLTPHFSLGVGPYYAKSSGNIVLHSGDTEQTVGYSDLNINSNDLGLVASSRFRTPITELFSFVLDARISVSTRNLDNSEGKSFRNRDLQTWIGVLFNL